MPTSVVGAIKLLDTTTPGTSSWVRFWLRGARGNEPRITATGAIAPQAAGSSFYVDIPADASGNVSGSIYSTRDSAGTGNGEIEVGGSYITVWYGMQIYNASIPGPEVPVHAKQGATLLIQNVTPITTLPIVASPTGDSTYARLDGGNSPFSGRIQQNGGDLVVSRTTTDTLTNKTLAGAVSGNNVSLINIQGPLAAIVGNGAFQNVYAYTIPAGMVGAGKGIKITAGWNHSTGTASVSYKFVLGSTIFSGPTSSANTGDFSWIELIFNATGLQNSQFRITEQLFNNSNLIASSGTSTLAENLANSLVLSLQFSVAATDQVMPKFWLVELIQ